MILKEEELFTLDKFAHQTHDEIYKKRSNHNLLRASVTNEE